MNNILIVFLISIIALMSLIIFHIYKNEKNFRNSVMKENLQILNFIQEINERLHQHSIKISNITYGGIALLQDRLLQSCRVFVERGRITRLAKMNIRNMYKWYSMYEKNEIVDYYVNEALKLDVETDKNFMPVNETEMFREREKNDNE